MPSHEAPVRLTEASVTRPMLALATAKAPIVNESVPSSPTTPPLTYFSEKLRATTCEGRLASDALSLVT